MLNRPPVTDMKVLMIGDVVGRPGRRAVKEHLPALREDRKIDLVIANAENLAGGNGITRETADELFSYGVDFLTGGKPASPPCQLPSRRARRRLPGIQRWCIQGRGNQSLRPNFHAPSRLPLSQG